MAPKGTILVTGANGGLGSAIVSHIVANQALAQDYHGLYTARNTKTATALSSVLQKPAAKKHQHDLVSLDLSSLASVRAAAADVQRRVSEGLIPPIRALILNAGWQEWTTHTITGDGFDMAFQANYLGHFLLTLLLLGSMDREQGRVVVLGSWSHDTQDKRNQQGPAGKCYNRPGYDKIFKKDPWNGEDIAKGRWSTAEMHPDDLEAGFRRYGAAKLCEVMMLQELSRRIATDPSLSRIAVLGFDPGAMPSGLSQTGPASILFIVNYVLPLVSRIAGFLQSNGDIRTTTKSASDLVRAAFDADALGPRPNGVYVNGTVKADVSAEAKDEELCRRLWTESLVWAGVGDGSTALVDWK